MSYSSIITHLGIFDNINQDLQDPNILSDIDTANQIAASAAGLYLLGGGPRGALATIQAGYHALVSGILVAARDIKEQKGNMTYAADAASVIGDLATIVSGVATLVPTPMGQIIAKEAGSLGAAATIVGLVVHNGPQILPKIGKTVLSNFGYNPDPSSEGTPATAQPEANPGTSGPPPTTISPQHGSELEVGSFDVDPSSFSMGHSPVASLGLPIPNFGPETYPHPPFEKEIDQQTFPSMTTAPGPSMLEQGARVLSVPGAATGRAERGNGRLQPRSQPPNRLDQSHRAAGLRSLQLPQPIKPPASGRSPLRGHDGTRSRKPKVAPKPSPKPDEPIRLWFADPELRRRFQGGQSFGSPLDSYTPPPGMAIRPAAFFNRGNGVSAGSEDVGMQHALSVGSRVLQLARGGDGKGAFVGLKPAPAGIFHETATDLEDAGVPSQPRLGMAPAAALPGEAASRDFQTEQSASTLAAAASPTVQPALTLMLDERSFESIVRTLIENACSGPSTSGGRFDPNLGMIPAGKRWDV